MVTSLAFMAQDSNYWTSWFYLAKIEHIWWTLVTTLLLISLILIILSSLSGNNNDSLGVLGLASASLLTIVQYLISSWRRRHFIANETYMAWLACSSSKVSPSEPFARLVIVKTIPFRLSDYKFTPYDYASYLRERSATLSQPNARAALLSGGIFWRIAQEHLSVDAALEGPSRVVTRHGVGQSFNDVASHRTYWDDSVDENVSNSICGLVNCYTGKLSSLGLQASLLTSS
jgi:hypothetical protein